MPDDEMIFPPGLPEEFQEKVKKMFDRQQMASQVTRQSISRFFQELSLDQLEVLKLLFNNSAANPVAAGFYEGMISGLMAQKFDKWPGWDDEDTPHIISFEFQPDGSIDATTVPADPKPQDSEAEFLATCEKYNVEPAIDDQVGGPVICRGCATQYVSLEDRMLRPADESGCVGCINKNKWG